MPIRIPARSPVTTLASDRPLPEHTCAPRSPIALAYVAIVKLTDSDTGAVAWQWVSSTDRVAVQVLFCPFCGAKLGA
jgi:hypothetical protein